LKLVLPAAHPAAVAPGPVSIADQRDDGGGASAASTGHHALVVGTSRALGGYDPDLGHRTNDADDQLDLERTAGAVALLPALTLPAVDPALAVREVAEAEVRRRLMVITRDGVAPPARDVFLAAVRAQAGRLKRRERP
jgi:hypothetical protein